MVFFALRPGIAGILALGLTFTLACTPATSSPPPLPLTAQVILGGQQILLEVARTPEEQAQGLMFRSSLPGDRGMLFEFSPPRVARFWMKNTLIPLDMIFIRQGVIYAIEPKVSPCRRDPCPVYGPLVEVDQVLELAAGRASALGLKKGQRISFSPWPVVPQL